MPKQTNRSLYRSTAKWAAALAIAITLAAPPAGAQDYVFMGNRNINGALPQPILTWENAPFVPCPAANGVGNSIMMPNPRNIVARAQPSGSVLVYAIANSSLFLRTYTPSTSPASGVCGSFASGGTQIDFPASSAAGLAVSSDGTKVYVGLNVGAFSTLFDQVAVVDVNLSTFTATYNPANQFAVGFADSMDVTPQLDKLLVAVVDTSIVSIFALNPTTGVPPSLPTPPVPTYVSLGAHLNVEGSIRVEPTRGRFAYFGTYFTPANSPTDWKVGYIDLNDAALLYSAIPVAVAPRDIAFDTVQDRVFFSGQPGQPTSYLISLDSASTNPVLSAVPYSNLGFQYYGTSIAINSSSRRLYLTYTAANVGDRFTALDLNPTSGYPDPTSAVTFNIPSEYPMLAVTESNLLKVTLTAIPQPGAVLSANGGPLTNSDTLYLPAGSTPSATVTTSQPNPLDVTAPRYDFLGWKKGSCADPNVAFLQNAPTYTTPALQPGTADTYYACFKTSYYLTVNVNGACTVSPLSGWQPDQSTVNFTVTPALPPVFINGAPKTVTVNCPQTVTVVVAPFSQLSTSIIASATGVSGLVTGNPSGKAVFTTITGPGSVSATPASIVVGGTTQWNLLDWDLNGTPFTFPVPTASRPVSTFAPNGTYTAIYTPFYQVLLNNVNGNCLSAALQPSAAFYKAGTSPIIAVSPFPGGAVTNILLNGSPIPPGPLPPLTGPVTITATCTRVCSTMSADPALTAWWQFEDLGGVANDATANNNVLIPINGGQPNWRPTGYKNRGVHFTSPSDALSAANSPDLNFGQGNFSFDFWANFKQSYPQPRTILRKTSPGTGYELTLTGTSLKLLINGAVFGTWILQVPDLQTWRFYAISVTRNAAPVLYLNAAVYPGATVVIPPIPTNNTSALFVGEVPSAPVMEMDLDELELFSKALGISEVASIFNAGPVGKCPIVHKVCTPMSAGMVGWYRFEEPASVNTFADSSSGSSAPLSTINGVPRGTGTDAKVGNSAYFDSTPVAPSPFNPASGSAAYSSADKFNFGTKAFSVDFWIKLDGKLSGRSIVSKYQDRSFQIPPGKTIGWSIDTTAVASKEVLRLFITDGVTTANYVGAADLLPNIWTHIAIAVPRNAAPVFYINGVLDSITGAAPPTGSLDTTDPLRVGDFPRLTLNQPGVATKFWLDEMELFNIVFTEPDVQKLVDADSKGKCIPTNTLILETSPAGLDLNYNSFTGETAPIYLPGPTGNTTTTAPSPQILNGTYYTFVKWTASSGTPPNGAGQSIPPPPPSTTQTWTANYNATGYVVTTTGCPVTVGPASQVIQTSPLVISANALLSISANPPTGQVVTLIRVRNAQNQFTNSTISPMSYNLTGPITIIATCSAPTNLKLTLETSPAGLNARIGTTDPYAPATPLVKQPVPANQPQTLSVTTPQVNNGTGYEFSNWTGATPANNPTATVNVGTTDATAKANFIVKCYLVTIAPFIGTGTVTATPTSPNVVPGFPSNCHSPGTVVYLNSIPGINQGLLSHTVVKPSGSQTLIADGFVTINGPTTITSKFAAFPNAFPSVIYVPTGSNGTYSTTLTMTNMSASPGTGLKITNVSFSPYTPPTGPQVTIGPLLTSLSNLVYGNLPASGSAGSNTFTYNVPTTVPSGTIFTVFLTIEVTNAAGDVFITTPFFSQKLP